jgi:hypothetical protein
MEVRGFSPLGAVMLASQLHRSLSIPREAAVFLPLPLSRDRMPTCTAFRTTWLASSLSALRERDLMDRYFQHLPGHLHASITGSVAGQWAPLELAEAHYAACDQLDLPDSELAAIGASVTRRVHGSVLSTAVKLAKQSGVTPWAAFSQFERLWSRVFDGGGVCVYQLGPKDSLVEVVGWPLARFRYVQHSMPAVVQATIELFCRRAFSVYLHNLSDQTSLVVHTSWV